MSKFEKSFAGGNPLKADEMNQMVAAINDNDDQIASLRKDTDTKLTELKDKTSNISNEIIETEDDSIVIASNDGNVIAKITPDSSTFKNLKSNGKDVLTEHQDISGLATKEELNAKQNYIEQISTDETSSIEEEQVWTSDDESEVYVKINSNGLVAKSLKYIGDDGKEHDVRDEIRNVEIHLSDIYAFVGDTVQIFLNSIIEDFERYIIKIDCKYGKLYPKYFECTPTTAFIEVLKVSVYNNNGVLLNSKTVNFVSVSASNPTSLKKILLVGASLYQNGEIAIELSRRLSGTTGIATSPTALSLSNYSIVGRIKNAEQSVGWEGIGGWSWNEYLGSQGNPGARLYVNGVTNINIGDRFKIDGYTQEFAISEKNITDGVGYVFAGFYGRGDIYNNHSLMPSSGTMTKIIGTGVSSFDFSNASVETYQPFWNSTENKWDIKKYCSVYCSGDVDAICVELGMNSLGGDAFADWSSVESSAKVFIDRVHSQMPNCKILLAKIILPNQIGGLGKDYTTNDGYGKYSANGFNKKVHNYNALLEKLSIQEEYANFVKIVDLCAQFDAINNYPTFDKPVNTRNPLTEKMGGNGVHPNIYGYWQMADAWLRIIINIIK